MGKKIQTLTDQVAHQVTNQVKGARGIRLQLRALSKSYAGRSVLKDIDVEVAPGEFLAVVGKSGCGKSTMLRLLAGLEQADGGSTAFGEDGKLTPDVRIMFQDSRLLPWKRVLDNVALGLPDLQAASRVLAQVGLAERASEWPAVLSGGQRQRVALARALVHDPQLLLLDEPLGALDALTRIEMQTLIEHLWRERGFTAVLVTHDVQEAIALADRVLLLDDGAVALDQKIDLPRPRLRGTQAFGEIEAQILGRILGHHGRREDVSASQSELQPA
jgi:sulfonate transport system ATP-binding protein